MKKLLFFILFLPVIGYGQIITTCVGSNSFGYTGDGGAATAATLIQPNDVAVDASGNIYIAGSNSAVRKVDVAGIITTVAGNDTTGYSGDGGAATAAKIGGPTGVAIDASGNLYISDVDFNVVRKVDARGIITTYAGNGAMGYSGDGGPATNAKLHAPAGMAVDAAGNLYIADNNNNVIRKINSLGTIITVAGNGYGAGVSMGGYSGDGGPAIAAELYAPFAVKVDGTGNIYIADANNHRVRKVNTSGIITTIGGNGVSGYSGDNGAATAAQLSYGINGLAIDHDNNIYVSDGASDINVIRKINAAGIITTYAGNGVQGFSGDGGPAVLATLDEPQGIAVSDSGILYIADRENNRIRKITAASEGVTNVNEPYIGIKMYPNPASSELTIVSTGKISNVIINDLIGQTVYNTSYNTAQVRVNIASLPIGIYIVKVVCATGRTITKKFVKE